jgi:predicted nuclease with RNAse H fold
MPRVVGVDLAVPGRGVTGLAAVDVDRAARMRLVDLAAAGSLEDAAAFAEKWMPQLVVVDAPLGLPRGGRGFRDAEYWAIRVLGARLLPLTLPSMRKLAEAGMQLRCMLDWVDVLETHPASVVRVAGAGSRLGFLACVGLRGLERLEVRDLVDAAIAAVTGALLHVGGALVYNDDAALVFPSPGLCGLVSPDKSKIPQGRG